MFYLNLLLAFAGYLLGRFGHAYLNVWLGNPGWAPHHWIYGALLMGLGALFRKKSWGWPVFFFGLGHFISDLKDFTELRFLAPDVEGLKKFWGID